MKLTPPALAMGVGFTAYEVTTAVMEVGAANAAIALVRNLADLLGELRSRLNSDDPSVRGEALADTLAIAGASTAIVGRLQQTGSNAITTALEKQAALRAEATALATAKVENNVYRDSSLADPSKSVYSATGPWIPAAKLTPQQADALIERNLPQGAQIVAKESADRLNINILKDDPAFAPPYVPGTQAVVIATVKETQFVRVYLPGTRSNVIGEWFMAESEIRGLTPAQIASKFALPQTPTHIVDVKVPKGQRLRMTVANDINIFPDKSIGGNGGGGGVQIQLLTKPKDPEYFKNWFSNERALK